MKKIHLFTLLLLLFIVFLPSCEQECRHEDMTESKTEPTCTQGGETVLTCNECGYSYKKEITEPKGHTLTATVTPKTCTTDGYTEYSCKCGFSYISDYVSASGHDYSDTITAPGCTSIGFTTHKCKSCSYTYVSNELDPSNHSYTKTVTPPTCTQQGYTTYACEKCDDVYISDYTSPAGHSITSVVTPAECNSEGYTTYSCENCEYSYIADRTEPTGHEMTSTTTLPTCTEEGKTTYSCENCDYHYELIADPLGHNFTKLITMPTLSDMGYTQFTCQNESCGYTYTGDLRFFNDILPGGAYAGNSLPIAQGIDVSLNNYPTDGSIDFESIKASGVDYVIIKAGSTYRNSFTLGGKEEKFEQSYADAKAAGLDVGVYFYTYATNVEQIIRDAKLLLSILDGKQFEYPIYLDLEDPSLESIDRITVTRMCVEFFTILQRAGYYTGLYVNDTWLKEHIDTNTALRSFEIWYARPNPEWDTERFGENLGMWQYTFEGTFDSMPGIPFDMSYAYKDYPQIIKDGGFNGYSSDEIVFVDSGKEYVYVIANALNVRSSPDFDSDTNIIDNALLGEYFEIVEKAETYICIMYNGSPAYITSSERYISFENPLIEKGVTP